MASTRLRLALLVVLVAAAAGLIALVGPHSPQGLRTLMAGFGPLAPLALLAAWVLLTPAMFPGTVLAAAGGLLLGTTSGLLVSVAGAVLGAASAFLVARIARPRQDFGPARLRAVQGRIERRPILAVALLRIAPGMPATLLNYAGGLSRIRLAHFTTGIALGGTPRAVLYTMVGATVLNPTSTAALITGGVLLATTVAAAAGAWLGRHRLGLARPATVAA